MTNREWLASMDSDTLTSFLFDSEHIVEQAKPVEVINTDGSKETLYFAVAQEPSPKFQTIVNNYTDSKLGFRKWVDEERKEA